MLPILRTTSETKFNLVTSLNLICLNPQYEFVTPLTSLVVVKPNETNTVNAESVDKHSKYIHFN